MIKKHRMELFKNVVEAVHRRLEPLQRHRNGLARLLRVTLQALSLQLAQKLQPLLGDVPCIDNGKTSEGIPMICQRHRERDLTTSSAMHSYPY